MDKLCSKCGIRIARIDKSCFECYTTLTFETTDEDVIRILNGLDKAIDRAIASGITDEEKDVLRNELMTVKEKLEKEVERIRDNRIGK